MIFDVVASIFKHGESMVWDSIYSGYRRRFEIAPSFRFNGSDIFLVDDGGRIVLGENSYIGRGSILQSSSGCLLKIGRNCSISHYVMMYTEGRDTSNLSRTPKFGDIIIGDNCWIGGHVFVREGVKIGDNVTVGANAVVTKDLPSNCVAVGAPARAVKFKDNLRYPEPPKNPDSRYVPMKPSTSFKEPRLADLIDKRD